MTIGGLSKAFLKSLRLIIVGICRDVTLLFVAEQLSDRCEISHI